MAIKQTEVELLAEIENLRKKLDHAVIEKTAAQEMATSMAEASAYSGGNGSEQPTGKMVAVEKCLNPAERDEKKLKFLTVDLPTFYYTIELPKGAGNNLMTNGIAYYHGMTYEVDQPTLTDLKSRVARTWDHEKSIHGENENAYRKPTETHFQGVRH